MRGIAINVGANTNQPGVRGPLYADGSFEYVPIPESEPTRGSVPTYADLDLDTSIPAAVRDEPVHLDPEFPEYAHCERYSYGDDTGMKAGRLTDLSAGDYVWFYATLSTPADRPAWAAPDWGAFLIGHFRLARDPVTGEGYAGLTERDRAPFANNAHVKRDPFDARVLLAGDPAASALYDRAIPLSARTGGADPNRLVTALSDDSGRGPWWRRPLAFDEPATETLLSIRDAGAYDRCFVE